MRFELSAAILIDTSTHTYSRVYLLEQSRIWCSQAWRDYLSFEETKAGDSPAALVQMLLRSLVPTNASATNLKRAAFSCLTNTYVYFKPEFRFEKTRPYLFLSNFINAGAIDRHL